MSVSMIQLAEESPSEATDSFCEAQVPPSLNDEEIAYKKTCGCIKSPRKRLILLVVVTATLAATVGVLLGYFLPQLLKDSCHNKLSSAPGDVDDNFTNEVNTKELEENLRFFSSKPHVGGSQRQKELADHIASKWRQYGFDEVEMPEYQVLLSLPQEDQPNTVEVVTNGLVDYTITGRIEVVNSQGASKSSFPYFPFIAYAPSGVAEGELVFCNQGSEYDFQTLDRMKISVKNRIVLIRGYSTSVTAAERRGAIGALLYVDPALVAPDGHESQETYPNKAWMSKDAVFSKALYARFGDPLTPYFPSIPGMYRRPKNQSGFPTIPVQPISYEDALNLLSRLKGHEVPPSWRGDLKVTYRFGPGFTNANTIVRLRVNNKLIVKSIINVIGTINGREEPDRYVLVGNHRDAEFFGAVDPSSGSAVLMEMSRILGKLKNQGWRPRRTVKLCSWGAEEFGLIGSVEWVQENAKLLSNRAVVYLNTDVAVGGDYVVVAQTCPVMEKAVFCRAKKVTDPNKKSVYDTMVSRMPSSDDHPDEPAPVPFLYFSDYLSFYMMLGIPSVDFSYFDGFKDSYRLYPVYHTQEDSFLWMTTFADPKFEYHATMTKLVGGMLLDFSEAYVLPLDVVRFSRALNRTFEYLEKTSDFGNISTYFVRSAIDEFVNASEVFQDSKDKLTGKESALILRAVNDQLVQVEKAFISPLLKSGDPIYRHIFSRNSISRSFPGVRRALTNARTTRDFSEVHRQLSLVQEAILSAADIIKPIVCKQ